MGLQIPKAFFVFLVPLAPSDLSRFLEEIWNFVSQECFPEMKTFSFCRNMEDVVAMSVTISRNASHGKRNGVRI